MSARVSAEVVANRRRWIEALESGEYEQTKGRLHDDSGYCCLGVACDLLNAGAWKSLPDHDFYGWRDGRTTAVISTEVMRAYGLIHACGIQVDGTPLTDLNDDGVPFAAIAAALRREFGPDLDRAVR